MKTQFLFPILETCQNLNRILERNDERRKMIIIIKKRFPHICSLNVNPLYISNSHTHTKAFFNYPENENSWRYNNKIFNQTDKIKLKHGNYGNN